MVARIRRAGDFYLRRKWCLHDPFAATWSLRLRFAEVGRIFIPPYPLSYATCYGITRY